MIVRGRVKDGRVVLHDDAQLPEGAEVRIEVASEAAPEQTPQRETTLYELLRPVAGIAKGLPSDLATNHDHYIHGQPKK